MSDFQVGDIVWTCLPCDEIRGQYSDWEWRFPSQVKISEITEHTTLADRFHARTGESDNDATFTAEHAYFYRDAEAAHVAFRVWLVDRASRLRNRALSMSDTAKLLVVFHPYQRVRITADGQDDRSNEYRVGETGEILLVDYDDNGNPEAAVDRNDREHRRCVVVPFSHLERITDPKPL